METYWPKEVVLSAGQNALLRHRPSKKLINYLEKYQKDLLTTNSPNGLSDFATQRQILLALMRQRYAEGQGYHQTVGGRNLSLPKFWELILSLDFVSHEIELTGNIGYDKSEIAPGIRSTVDAPYAEFVIVSNDLKRLVASRVADTPAVQSTTDTEVVKIAMTAKGEIYADLNDTKYLIKKLRRDSAAYNFMNYMLGHQNQDIPRGDIQTKVDGCAAKKDITELARLCGFTKDLLSLKAAYFGGTTKLRAHFKADARLSTQQVDVLVTLKRLIA